MSGNRITAFIIVALIHIALVYALVTGLAYEAAKKVIQKVTTVDIKEEEKKEEPPPPPPKKEVTPPPPVAPPVKINVAVAPPQIVTVQTPPPPAPIVLAPPPVVAPPPPPPSAPPKMATPKNNQATWVTDADYPTRALREERQGVTAVRLSIGTDGRVTGCTVTRSSGSPDLDETACTNISRRARFNPAMENGQPVAGSFSRSVRWVVPKD
jgi:protein TonB